MCWGSFSWQGPGPLCVIDGIMDSVKYVKILNEIMLPYAEEEMPLIWTFQQDNDPKHTSKLTQEWFAEKNVNVLAWPSQSPDLNPIENLWSFVKRKLAAGQKPSNKTQLFERIKSIWDSIPIEYCRALINSMQRRCQAVIVAKGSATKY